MLPVRRPGGDHHFRQGCQKTTVLGRSEGRSRSSKQILKGKPKGQQAKHKGWDLRRMHLLLAELVTVSVQLTPVCHSQ